MSEHTPESTVSAFVEAVNRGDLSAALTHYESDAVFVPQPGAVVVGLEGISEALSGMLAMRPHIVTERFDVAAGGDIALYHSRWSMTATGEDGVVTQERGLSADVLRRQPNGEWKIAIDNPWGAGVLPAAG